MDGIKIEVTGNILKVAERPKRITSGTVGLPVEFVFDEAWDGMTKTAVFRAGCHERLAKIVEEKSTVPWEILEKERFMLAIGVYGVNDDGTIAIPTIWANVGIIHEGASLEGDATNKPGLPIWKELENDIGNLSNLKTKAKSNLVEAINEIQENAPSGGSDNAVLFTPQYLKPDQKAQARENIGAAQDGEVLLRYENPDTGVTDDSEIGVYAEAPITDETGDPLIGRVSFYEHHHDGRCQLTHLADGTEEDHAATVGQVMDMGMVKEVRTITHRYGDSLLTDGIVTLGAGWSGNLSSGFEHATKNGAPLTFNIGAMDGEKFLIAATLSENESVLTLKIGDSYPTDPYGDPTAQYDDPTDPYNVNKWFWCVKAVGDNSSLTITPKKEWAGKILTIDVRKLTEDGNNEKTLVLDNIAHEKMANHLSGFWDIQIGNNALRDSINTTRCIAIGNESLSELQTGGRNIGLGTFTLPHMKYGEDNIAIGADSGLMVKEAHQCVSIGKGAMQYGTKLKKNVAIGWQALAGTDESTAESNIAIGDNAGYGCAGKSNVLIGDNTGYKSANGVMNVFIGQNAGSNATSWGCTAVGAQAETGAYSTSTAIGYQAKNTKSSQVVIGGDNVVETLVKGNLVVRGTDGVKRQIVFNADGTCSWTAV